MQQRVEYDSRSRIVSLSSALTLSLVYGKALSCSSLWEISLGVLFSGFFVVFCDIFVRFLVRFVDDWIVGCEYKKERYGAVDYVGERGVILNKLFRMLLLLLAKIDSSRSSVL